jgi:hypothetical protein
MIRRATRLASAIRTDLEMYAGVILAIDAHR